MKSISIVDRFCPQNHEAAITAVAYDPQSDTRVTADANGLIVVCRNGEATPGLTLQAKGAIRGALALMKGGSRLAVGDDSGTIYVYDLRNGELLFIEERSGERGLRRAFRGISINKTGTLLAAVSIDNLLRIWDLRSEKRLYQWYGFDAASVTFDERGERVLAITQDGQPNLIDIWREENLYLQNLQTPCQHVMFTPDGRYIIAAGSGGFYLLDIAAGQLSAGFATQRSSGIVDVVVSPNGYQVATITRRNIHLFNLPSLEHQKTISHGAGNPGRTALWDQNDIWVGGDDGMLHSPNSGSGIAPITTVNGFGQRKISIHDNAIAVWKRAQRKLIFDTDTPIHQAYINREGNFIITQNKNGTISVFNAQTGKEMMQMPQETAYAKVVHIGGVTIVVELENGGCYWCNLNSGKAFQLKWPIGLSISNGGDLLAVITPQGKIRLLSTSTAKACVTPPKLPHNSQAKHIAFVNRSPILIVLDNENVLSYYHLEQSVNNGPPANGVDLIQLEQDIDRMWGLTLQGQCWVAIKIVDEERALLLWVPIEQEIQPFIVEDIHPDAWVDPMTGNILEPAKCNAILEKDMNGNEQRVYRSLPGDQWLSFDKNGILEKSNNLKSQFY